MQVYDHRLIESQAQEEWKLEDVYRVVEFAKTATGQLKPKFYACSMLPYPSGSCIWGMSAITPSMMSWPACCG